jgi:thymidylate kinase
MKGLFNRRYTAFPEDIEKEFYELISIINKDKFNKITIQCRLNIDNELFTEFLDKFTDGRLRFYDVFSGQCKIFYGLKKFKRETGPHIYLKYLYLLLRHSSLAGHFIQPRKKTIDGQGKVISLVGADGAGKSTHVAEIEKWLSWKLDVVRYYYGIPKTFQVGFLSLFIRTLLRLRLTGPAGVAESLLWLYVARKRAAVSASSQRDRQQGRIVITDRFPMKAFFSMPEPMDGPRIQKCVKHPVPGFSRSEIACYNKILPPDRVFVLQVDSDELRRRKSDLDAALHKIKADAVNAIREEGPVMLVDANRPCRQVQLDLKRRIWSLI